MSGSKAAETQYPRTWAIVSIIGAAISAGVAVWNAWSGAEKADFESANAIADLYFERVKALPTETERHCPQLRFAALTAVVMAGREPSEVEAEFNKARIAQRQQQAARAEAADGTTEAVPMGWQLPTLRTIVPAVSRVVYADMRERWVQSCEARCSWPGPGGEVQCGVGAARAGDPSAAAPSPPSALPATPLPQPYTVYIQYRRDSDRERDEASALQARIAAGDRRNFLAPGIEGVRQVPASNQIRIYRNEDRPVATLLSRTFGLEGYQVVNIKPSVPNRDLPPRVMEVWLAAP